MSVKVLMQFEVTGTDDADAVEHALYNRASGRPETELTDPIWDCLSFAKVKIEDVEVESILVVASSEPDDPEVGDHPLYDATEMA